MKSPVMKLCAAAICLAFGTCAWAGAPMSKSEYHASQKAIDSDADTAKAACKSLVANAKDICMAEAKGKESVALAQLEERYKPGTKTHYGTLEAQAKADHAVAKEKCDDATGNAKDVCVKQADAAQSEAMANAKAAKKSAEAKAVAHEKTAKANGEASRQVSAARHEAADEKLKADYSVAREKCDAQVGEAKDACVKNAKAAYGKT